MTAENTAPNMQSLFRGAMNAFRRAMALTGQIIFGGLVVLAAGVLAVATAVIGLLLALAAIIIGLASGRNRVFVRSNHQTSSDAQRTSDGESVTLEARKTPHGWTVE